jgi:hypothetical protein
VTEGEVVEVGPVLEKGDLADAILTAIRQQNEDVRVVDRDSYWRVLVRQRCVVTRDAIESALGRSFVLPSDLELCMPSFCGRFTVTPQQALWEGVTRKQAD